MPDLEIIYGNARLFKSKNVYDSPMSFTEGFALCVGKRGGHRHHKAQTDYQVFRIKLDRT